MGTQGWFQETEVDDGVRRRIRLYKRVSGTRVTRITGKESSRLPRRALDARPVRCA